MQKKKNQPVIIPDLDKNVNSLKRLKAYNDVYVKMKRKEK